MILIGILSVILIWVHISSLRFIIRSNASPSIIEETEKLEANIPDEEKNISLASGPGLLSLIVIILMNLIEIGYFAACVYIFGGMIITIGSSIIVGYTIYSFIRFIPNMKKFYSKPSEYLKEKTSGLENILSFVMTSLEIVFCIYIIIRVLIEFSIFDLS